MNKIAFIFLLVAIISPLSARRFYITNNMDHQINLSIVEIEEHESAEPTEGAVLAGPVSIPDGEARIFDVEGTAQAASDKFYAIIAWDDQEIKKTITVTQDNDFYIDEHGDIEEQEYPEGPIIPGQ
ncbi:MAG TPA: hypothetical protein VFF04_05195 [Candidatus Babeliales bacterium]|nr:hypothetical protein [Candidatus Babeliales bacterium]